ncbi:MAG: hypothetical protein VX405_10865 [Myxococcota bacterium]|nr:hypothetical protein [Myxococcota bacterium]
MRAVLSIAFTCSFIACMPPIEDGQNATSVTPEGEFDPGRRANSDENNGGSNTGDPADGEGQEQLAPGSACNCDSECAGSEQTPGLCFQGICMTRASRRCSQAGSTIECQEGLRCWGAEEQEGSFCWADCDAFNCDGTCDADGSCVPDSNNSCDNTCSAICNSGSAGGGGSDPCEGVTCAEDEYCAGGQCYERNMDIPDGRIPGCIDSLPDLADCNRRGGNNACSELVQFDPRQAYGYWDYPLNGETERDQYRSWARRDLLLLVRYATAATECLTDQWDYHEYRPLGLGDMSEANGEIPGTRESQPGHPEGTHVNGHDMDIAYYQVGTPNNVLRSVCEHRQANGQDAYHCTGEPVYLDAWRTAVFLAYLHDNPHLRVIGVDGRVGPLVNDAIRQLCASDWLRGKSICRQSKVTFETTNQQRGWFYFHHHHLHLSLSAGIGR